LIVLFYSKYRLAKNYYEILGVDQKCSNKEIRLAYLTLCKQYHPDLNRNEDKTQSNKNKFQDINQAYNCLIKDNERLAYDQYLRNKQYGQNTSFESSRQNNYSNYYYGHYNNKHNYDEYDFEDFYERIRRRQYEQMYARFNQRYHNRNYSKDFYGIKGVKKVENSVIVSICGFVIFFGVILHMVQYRISINQINEMNDHFKRNALVYEQVKRRAR